MRPKTCYLSVSSHPFTVCDAEQEKKKKTTTNNQTWRKLNKYDIPNMFHAQSTNHPPPTQKKKNCGALYIAHWKIHRHFAKICHFDRKLCHEKYIGNLDLLSHPMCMWVCGCACVCYSYVSAQQFVCVYVYSIVAIYMIKSKSCVLKLSSINNNNNE